MIRDRPASLAGNPHYTALPEGEIVVDLSSLPEILRLDLDSLSGIQPITRSIVEAAGGLLRDDPSPGEIALHLERGTAFQMVFVVFNLCGWKEADGRMVGRP